MCNRTVEAHLKKLEKGFGKDMKKEHEMIEEQSDQRSLETKEQEEDEQIRKLETIKKQEKRDALLKSRVEIFETKRKAKVCTIMYMYIIP